MNLFEGDFFSRLLGGRDQAVADIAAINTELAALRETQKELKLVECIAIAVNVGRTKSGKTTYTKWRNRKLRRLTDITDELDYENKTIFEKIRSSKSKTSNTIFDRIRREKNGI